MKMIKTTLSNSKYYFKGYLDCNLSIHARISLKEHAMYTKNMNKHHKHETEKYKNGECRSVCYRFWWN